MSRKVVIAGMEDEGGSPRNAAGRMSMTMGALGGLGGAAAAPAAAAAAAAEPDEEPRELKLGDVIYLSANNQTNEGQDEDGYVHGEGTCDPRVGLRWVDEGGEPLEMYECLFRVVPRLSYKASKSVDKFQRQNSLNAKDLAAQMSYLRDKATKEEAQNANLLSQLHENSTAVCYGQTVQLQHVASGKFLSLIPRALADVVKEALRVNLVDGSDGSFFKFRPRYKNRVDGRPVLSNDQVTLTNIKADMSLHSGRGELFQDDPFQRSELSLSPDMTGFRVVVFHSVGPDDSRWLRAGAGVRLLHAEAEAMLTASANRFTNKAPYLYRKKKEEDDDIDDDVNLSTKSIWFVERPVRRDGGFMQWTDVVRLRHAGTGRYLMVEHEAVDGQLDADLRAKADTGPCFRALLADPLDDDDERAFFRFHAVAATFGADEDEVKGIPTDGLSVFLEHPLPPDDAVVEETPEGTQVYTSCWLHNTHIAKRLDDEDVRANLGVGFCASRLDEDSLTIIPADEEEVSETLRILAGLSYAQAYCDLLRTHPNSERQPLRPKDLRSIKKMLSMVIFATTADAEMEEADKPMEAEGLPIAGPQEKMRELKMLDGLFAMLRAPLEAGVTLQQLTSEPRWALIKQVHLLVFKAITQVFSQCSRNELYVTNTTYNKWMLGHCEHSYMTEITRQLGHDLGAADCLKALISYNVRLLEEKIDFSTTTTFVDLIKIKGPVDEFVKFLAALCSCQGKTFSQNQELLLQVVYSAASGSPQYANNRREMLLETMLSATRTHPWTRAEFSPRPSRPFMASECYDEGCRDILVAWSSSDSWSDEKMEGAFYLPPGHMDLNVVDGAAPTPELEAYGSAGAYQWVRLEELAWVLDPGVYYQKVYPTGKSWAQLEQEMAEDDALFDRFELKRELAEYYVAQIHMFAAMCSGRTYSSIRCIEQQFSFELLITAVSNDRLPEELRTAFAEMLFTVHVDRFPHEPLRLPRLVRVHDEVVPFALSDGDALPQYHIADDSPLAADEQFRSADKFFVLQDVIQRRLELCAGTQVIEQTMENGLTLAMLKSLQALLQFGFFSSIEHLRQLADPVVQLLDGRGDVMTADELEEDLQARRASRGARPSIHMGSLLGLRKKRAESMGAAAAALEEKSEELSDAAVGAALLGDDLSGGVKRYASDPEQLLVAQAKRALAAIVGIVADIRADFRLRRLLLALKERPEGMAQLLEGGSVPRPITLNGEQVSVQLSAFEEEEEREKPVQPWLTEHGIRAFNALFEGAEQTPDAKQLEMASLSDLPFHTTCLDLMMYEDPELFEAALRALVRQCSQRQELLDNVCEVQLLVSEDSIRAQRVLERELGVLKNRLDDFETWAGDAGATRAVNEAVTLFAELCVSPRAEADMVPGEPPYVPNTGNQDLLRNMGVHQVILKAYDLPISDADLAARQGTVFNLRKLCNDLLGKFCLGNTENQDIMFEYLVPVFMPQVGSGTGIAALIANIFRNNRNLCSQVPEDIIWQFANQIERKGCFQRFLTFFFCVVEPEGSPIQRNQEVIINIFTDEQFHNILMCFNHGTELSHQTVESVAQTEGFLARKAQMAAEDDQQIAYHTKLVDLLATVARGKSTVCEVKCQNLLPAHHVLAVLLDADTTLPVRQAFMAFLAEVYFETDIAEFELLNVDRHVWMVLDGIARDLRTHQNHLDELSREQTEFLFQRQLVAVEHFFAGLYSPEALADMDDAAFAEGVVAELKAVVEVYSRREYASKLQAASVAAAAAALGLVAAGSADEHSATRTSYLELQAAIEEKRTRELFAVSGPLDALNAFVGAAKHDKRMRTFCIEDFDQLAQYILNVEKLTAKDDEEFVKAMQRGDAAARADERANTITFEQLVKRICAHVRDDHDDNIPLISTAVRVLAHIIDFQQPRDRERNQVTYMLEDVDVTEFYAPQDRTDDYENFVKIQEEMDSYGCSRLVVDLLSDPALHDKLAIQTLKLAIELLEGGNAKVQQTIFDYCEELGDDVDKFFIALQKRIQRAIADIQSRRRRKKFQDRMSAEERAAAAASSAGGDDEEEADLIGVDLVFHMLQLFAEGHNVLMQDLMRDQSSVGVRNSTNLIEEAISFLGVLAKNEKQLRKMSGEDSQDLVALLEFLTEVVQGPCEANQVLLANSILVDTCSSIMWIQFEIGPNINALEVRNLKGSAVRAVLSLLEGRSDTTVHTVLAQKLEPKLIRARQVEIYEEYLVEKKKAHDDEGWDEELLEEGFNLHKLVMALTSADAVEQAVACRHFEAGMSATIKPSAFKDPSKLQAAVQMERRYIEAKTFFQSRMVSIEVCWGDPPHLERIYFPLSSECEFLSEAAKGWVKANAEYGTDDQTAILMTHKDKLIDEMQHLENCSRSWIYRKIGIHLPMVKTSSFLLAILMNTLIVLGLEASVDEDADPVYNPEEVETVMLVLGIPQAFLSFIVLLFLSWNRLPLIFNEHDRARKAAKADVLDMFDLDLDLDLTHVYEQSKQAVLDGINCFFPTIRLFAAVVVFTLILLIRVDDIPAAWYVLCLFIVVGSGVSSARRYLDLPDPPFKAIVNLIGFPYKVGYDFLTTSDTLFYALYFACSLLGLLWKPYFYVFHLLDIIVMSDSLKNVVRAVTQPGKALSLTALLGVITIYIFALGAFYFLRWTMYDAEQGMNECSTMIKCFSTYIHAGLLYGGGIGDYSAGELGNVASLNDTNMFMSKMIYDLLYFVLVVILLLNIIFGIIIDTFSSLRESDAEKDDLMRNFCFICGVPKDTFDNLGRDVFKKHISEEHNMWAYLFYQAFLLHKDETDYTGAETAIAGMIEAQDVSWFPHGDALVLQQAE